MCHQRCAAPVRGGSGIAEERIEIPGANQSLPAFLARPEEARAPGVLIVHDIWGANDFYHDLARRLAGEGFAAMLPDFFVRQGPLATQTREAAFARAGQLDQEQTLRDIGSVLDWLRTPPQTSGKVGTVGFCLGGTFVFLAAARSPLPDASVAFYGFPAGRGSARTPLVPIDEAAEVRSPLLAFWGDQDSGVGMENVETYRGALAVSDVRHEFVIYPGLPHGFLTFDPASPNYEGAHDAWTRTLAFLHAELDAQNA